jgi:hypothetical protein
LKDVGKLPNQIHNYNPSEDVDGCGAFYKSINVVQQYSNKNDVKDINDADLQKIERIQMKFFIKLSKIHKAKVV